MDIDKINQAKKELKNLKNLIAQKVKENLEYIENFTPENSPLAGKSTEELLSVLDEAFPGFAEQNKEIFLKKKKETGFIAPDGNFTEEEILQVVREWQRECERPEETVPFSHEEIETVAQEIAKECATFRPAPFVPFSSNELEQICKEEPETGETPLSVRAIVETELEEEQGEIEYDIAALDKLASALKEPRLQLVFAVPDAKVLYIFKKEGEKIFKGMPILETGAGPVVSPCTGTIKKIFVDTGEKTEGKNLFLIEKTDEPGFAEKIFALTKKQIAETDKFARAKTLFPDAQKEAFFSEIAKVFWESVSKGFREKKEIDLSLPDLVKELQIVLEKFSNEFSCSGLFAENVRPETLAGIFPAFRLLKRKGDAVYDEKNVRKNISGTYHDLQNELVASVSGNANLRELEKNFQEKISKSFGETLAGIALLGEKFGHLYAKLGVPSGEIETKIAEAKEIYKKKKENFEKILKILENTEKFFLSFEKEFEKEAKEAESPYKIFAEGEFEGNKAKIFFWTGKQENNSNKQFVQENLNFRGNPAPVELSPPVTSLDWWKKFCELASKVHTIPVFYPVGMLVPGPNGIVKIPLPVVWKPFAVVPFLSGLFVAGIAQAGVLPCPFVVVLNAGKQPLGPVPPESIFLAGAVRPMQKIKSKPGTKIMPVAPIADVNGFKIDLNPFVTQNVPFVSDDFPPYERLSLRNSLFLTFLADWCAAGKKGQGFFENP